MSHVIERVDDYGIGAWIALMVVSFVLVWPVGLALLAFLIWSGRMSCRSESGEDRWERGVARMQGKFGRWGCGRRSDRARQAFAPSGNRAFDEYREETLKRLEEEAQEFTSYLERLRHAKDKAEFEQFMDERRNRPPQPSAGDTQGSLPR